jgi:hypothetical protein
MAANYFVNADCILDASTIRQVRATDHKTNMEIRKAMTSGGNAVTLVAAKMANEVTSVTSGDLAGLLALNSTTFCSAGLYIASGTITVPYKKRAAGGSFASGSSHPALTGTKALIIPTLIEATQEGDEATCQFEIHWLSADGVTKACDDASGAALGSQSFSAEYCLGPAYINATLLTGVQGVRITPGIEVVKSNNGAGQVWPVFASIKNIVPTMEITINDFDAFSGTVGDVTAMTSANVYFRLRSDSGLYNAAGSNIVRLTFAAGIADTGSVTTSQNDDGSATITLHGKTLTASTTASIP